MEHPQYTVCFGGAPMDVYDVDDLLRRAHENSEIFSTLALSPDLRENLREALFHIRQLEPGNYEIVEITHLKTRWGDVDVVVDETLPFSTMTLR
jgi:predicted  nucleic acid-binding Zn-ribbon protein